MDGELEKEWTEKYRPKKLRDIVGNERAIDELSEWAENVFKPKSKKAAILHGPAGCGKTSAAYALASEKGWEVIELNASDKRNAGAIKNIVGPASTSDTIISHRTRLIILDEADNLHGNEDRGGKKAITEIVKKSAQPIILTANDKFGMGQGLLRNCKVITFQRIKPGTVFRVLRRISEKAGIGIADAALLSLAKNAHGDLRSAINDLHALSMAESNLEQINEEDIATGGRDVEEDIFSVLRLIFGMEGKELQSVLSALYSLDKTPEESIQWIYKNFSYEYDAESFLHGLHYLSRADMFLGRVRRRENYKFWRYASGLMSCGVLSAKEMREGKRDGWQGQKQRRFYTPWQRLGGYNGGDKKTGPIQGEIAERIAAYCKLPRSYALFLIVPLLTVLFENEQKATEITASLHLDVSHIAFLLGDGDKEGKEKAKRIYQNALTVTARKGKERVPGEEQRVGEAEVREIKRIKPRKVEITEEETAEPEDQGAEDQKTLADFF